MSEIKLARRDEGRWYFVVMKRSLKAMKSSLPLQQPLTVTRLARTFILYLIHLNFNNFKVSNLHSNTLQSMFFG